jgi:anti-anti-sigma factor
VAGGGEEQPQALTVRCGFQVGAVVVAATGEIDVDTVPELERQVVAALDAATAPTSATAVVVDLTDAFYLDSSGLNMLVRCNELARRHGTALRVVAADRRVLRPILITDLERVLALYPTLADALAPPAAPT